MRRLLKPLRVLLALALFLCVNAAFLAPAVKAAFLLDGVPDFAWAARVQFLPALVALNVATVAAILVATALVGRVYCSTLCPLGVLQDIVLRLRRLVKRPSFAADWPRFDFRWAVLLAAVLPLAFCGVTLLVSALDPYSAYGRVAADLVRPAFQGLLNLGADWSDAHEKYWLMRGDVALPSAFALLVAALTLAAVAALAAWKGRWFCNRLCPAGACLALAARRPLVRLSIDAASCVSCGLCEKGCKAGAIDAKGKVVDNSRCVRCFNCLGTCGKGAVRL